MAKDKREIGTLSAQRPTVLHLANVQDGVPMLNDDETEQRSDDAWARLSKDEVYRYYLEYVLHEHGDASRLLMMIMLNPSTADAFTQDQTAKRCIDLAHQLQMNRLGIVNLFALRATKPKELYRANDPVGRHNDYYISWAVARASLIVAGWGINGTYLNRGRQVGGRLARLSFVKLHCLDVTENGMPKHPLYITRGTIPRPYP